MEKRVAITSHLSDPNWTKILSSAS